MLSLRSTPLEGIANASSILRLKQAARRASRPRRKKPGFGGLVLLLVGFHDCCCVVQFFGKKLQLLCSELSIFSVDSFVDPRDDYGCVSGVLSGRVNRVPEPWPVG